MSKSPQQRGVQHYVTGRWFSLCTTVFSTNKTDRYDITEILLKVALNTINQKNPSILLGPVVQLTYC